ncbi:MAG: hypothetical protein DCF31_15590 [Alphaproteobacteria bacterium]|nr:MAG: hypothetical protein DCF31_15590 [Alphaproteobacteria bacterium]
MRAITLALTSLALVGATAATAQTTAPAAGAPAAPAATAAPMLTPGSKIYDPQGAEIATVDSVSGANVVVSTGTNKLTIPASSFGPGANGPVIAATREQLDAAAAQATAASAAALEQRLVAGTDVHGSGGMVVGKVKSRDDSGVLVTTPKGDVRVPLTSLTADATGLAIGMTAAEFDAAVAAAKS